MDVVVLAGLILLMILGPQAIVIPDFFVRVRSRRPVRRIAARMVALAFGLAPITAMLVLISLVSESERFVLDVMIPFLALWICYGGPMACICETRQSVPRLAYPLLTAMFGGGGLLLALFLMESIEPYWGEIGWWLAGGGLISGWITGMLELWAGTRVERAIQRQRALEG